MLAAEYRSVKRIAIQRRGVRPLNYHYSAVARVYPFFSQNLERLWTSPCPIDLMGKGAQGPIEVHVLRS